MTSEKLTKWAMPAIVVVALVVVVGVIVVILSKKGSIEKYGAWGNSLAQGELLETHQALQTWDQWGGHTKLVMQWDGNLVMYHNNQYIWASHTSWSGANRNGYQCRMQPDGNLVIYNKDNWQAIWASQTFNPRWNNAPQTYWLELSPKCARIKNAFPYAGITTKAQFGHC